MARVKPWKIRALGNIRGTRKPPLRGKPISGPAVPTGIKRREAFWQSTHVRPVKSRELLDAAKHRRFKKKLMVRFDVDEYNRRENLTTAQHFSPTGKIGSEGFRKYTTIRNIPHNRDRSPYNRILGKKRQYATQLQSEYTQKHNHSADQNVFRDKRTVYQWRKSVLRDGLMPMYQDGEFIGLYTQEET